MHLYMASSGMYRGLGEGKNRTQKKTHLLPPLTQPDATHTGEEYEEVCGRLFHLNNCLRRQKCPVSLSILRNALLKHSN